MAQRELPVFKVNSAEETEAELKEEEVGLLHGYVVITSLPE